MKYIFNDKTFEYEPYVQKWKFLKFFSIILLAVTMFFLGTIAFGPEKEVKIKLVTKASPIEFTEENLKLKLEELCVMHVDVVMQQAKHETGNFNSELFLNANNLFGMKVAYVRPRLQRGNYKIGTQVYAKYNTWEESVIDYALWQATLCYTSMDQNDYYDYLGRVYATDKHYVKKLKRIVI